jgi:glutamine synthetase
VLRKALGVPFCDDNTRVKRSEKQRYADTPDQDECQRREYFSRF